MAVRLGPVHEKRRTCLARTCAALEHIEGWVDKELVPLVLGEEIAGDRSFKPAVSPEVDLPLRLQCLLQAVVLSILQLGTYLNGWTPKWEGKHPTAIPEITQVPLADEKQTGKLEDHVTKILGSLPRDSDIAKAIVDIEATVKTLFDKGLPKWMDEFMEDLHEQFENRRTQYLDRLRNLSANLRQCTGKPIMSEQTIGFIRDQWQSSFKAKVKEKRRSLDQEMETLKHLQKEIERQLGPWLASPNARHILDDLRNKETKRYEDALSTVDRYETEFTTLFWDEALGYRKTLQTFFSVFLKIIDALPLPEHFQTSMSEVDDSAKRQSLKRRLRSSESKIPDELPPRTWEGMISDKIIEMMKAWGEQVADIEPELAVQSYRSPVHKALFHKRNKVYDEGLATFDIQQKMIRALIDHYRTGEHTGHSNFKRMTQQLLNVDD
eukprot:GEMP01059442.1.p1 GENE.GEMP01059442.1~~GEMP01059442.1.p1  ORF type:complete len:437 (+),score=76.59 GEMP01059442.1:34-1344(+)